MDPNPRNYPILSYVMSKLPKLGSFKPGSTTTDHLEPDIENQPPRTPSSPGRILDHMPRLTDPKILAEMTRAISEIAQTRSVLQILGERPDHEAVDTAKVRIAEIDANLSKELEEITLSPPPQSGSDVNRLRLEKEKERKEAAEEERRLYGAVIELDEMHEAYGKLLKEAEEKLVKIYESADMVGEEHDMVVEEGNEEGEEIKEVDELNDEVAGVLKEGLENGLERVYLSGRGLRFMPEAFGRIRGLVVLDLSSNQLKAIPDSVAGLNNLEELKLSSNLLESLPDSIGLLHSLKILDVSKNKLNTLPDSICHCKSLVELDASYNKLTYLPTNIGYELINLRRLSIHLNKLRSLPSSICEMTSLCHLDAHFNELHGLPLAIGRLTNLESLNLSSNFNDMTQLPETFGDLINLKELDLSNNQIHALPDTFCRLQNLNMLNLDQNPIVIPPLEVVNQGVMAVMVFMTKRLHEILAEQERKSMIEIKEQTQTGWLTRSTSWLNNFVSGVSGNVTGYLAPKSPTDPFLDQQL